MFVEGKSRTVFLDALASLRSKLRPTDRHFLIAKITPESITENETVLCQYQVPVNVNCQMSNVKSQMPNVK